MSDARRLGWLAALVAAGGQVEAELVGEDPLAPDSWAFTLIDPAGRAVVRRAKRLSDAIDLARAVSGDVHAAVVSAEQYPGGAPRAA